MTFSPSDSSEEDFFSFGLDFLFAGCYWRVQRADGTNRSGTTSEFGTIQDGDVYTQFAAKAYFSGQYVLQIFADCDVNEMDNVSGYGYIISAGSLTVHHTVDGADKSFVLTSSKTKLSDFADGAQWCVNGETVNMSSDVPLAATAYTTAQSYNVTIAAMENGSVTANSASAYQGTQVILTIAPAAGYSLSKLIVNDEDVTASVSDGIYMFVMPEGNVNVSATFSLTAYRVSANNSSYGDTTLSATEATAGTEITVTLAPTTCYTLQKLTVDGEDVTAEVVKNAYTFTMPSHNVVVNADFALIAYSIQGATDGKAKVGDTLTVTPHGQEFVLWFSDEGYFAEGQSVTVEEKYAGKTITCKIYVHRNSSPAGSGGYIADYPAATLTVQVEGDSYAAITIDPSIIGGTVVADKPAAKQSDTVTLTVTPDTNYALDSLTVNDGQKNIETTKVDDSTYTFIMPAGDVTVTAVFKEDAAEPSYIITIPSSVSLNDEQSMTITASDVQNLADGQSINVAVTSANGGKLKFGANEISYSFAQSLNFIQNGNQNLVLTIGNDETTGKPAGTYTDTLNFSVSLTSTSAGE